MQKSCISAVTIGPAQQDLSSSKKEDTTLANKQKAKLLANIIYHGCVFQWGVSHGFFINERFNSKNFFISASHIHAKIL